ncbi:MAG: T9SS type A sorting domain-containing protein, partial [Saprospiraceae bacterium]
LTMNNLAPGTYVIVVDGWQGAHCNYSLTVQCTAVITCTAPICSQVYFTNLTTNSLRINCSASGVCYDWSYRPAGGSWVELPSTTQNYCDISNLQPGVTYCFMVAIKCCNNVWSNWSPYCYCTTPSNNPGCSCNSAIAVTCGNSYGGNNGTGGHNYTYYTYNGQTATEIGPEVIYQFTVAANSSYTVNLTNLYGDLDLFLLSSCSGNNAVVKQSGHSGTNSESITFNNLPAGTYYIVVDGWNGCISNYLLTIICNANGGNNNYCSNDDPCGAQILYPHSSCEWIAGTNVGSTGTTNPVPAGGCNNAGMHDVWYAVQIPSTGQMHVSTGAGTLTDGLLSIYSGSNCCNLCCYGCMDNTSNGNLMPGLTITGTPGLWVFLRVWGYNGSVGTFTICVTNSSNGGNLQSNDEAPTVIIDANSSSDRTQDEKPEAQPADAGQYALQVYPVPARDEVNFSAQLPVDQEATIRVFDLNGRLVKERQGLQSTDGNLLEHMEVGELPTGLYLVKVRAGETELTGKFSKSE